MNCLVGPDGRGLANVSGSGARARAASEPRLTWQTTPANSFGGFAALLGILAGELCSALTLGIVYGLVGHGKTPSELARDIGGLIGLWIGFIGTAAFAAGQRLGKEAGLSFRRVYGLAIRPIDLPVGIVVGLAGQFLLVPLLELPLLPFVPHLFQRLGNPARTLTAGESGFHLAILGVLICLGSPLVEEIFFRGLLFRGLLGTTRDRLGWPAGRAVLASAAVSGIIFGLVHFEALQLIALCGFGMVLALLAAKTGRLGAGIVAHISFNTVTFIALATGH